MSDEPTHPPTPVPTATERSFRILVEQVADYAIFMLDANGCVATWNVGAQRIKGYAADEIIGQHFSRFYPEEDVRAGKCEMELEVATRVGRFEDEGWRVRKDGTRFWANVVITPLRDSAGALLGFAKVTRDLTERRRAEEQRVQLAEQAAGRARAEGVVALVTRLQQITGALAASRTTEEMGHVLTKDACLALGASAALVVAPIGDQTLELVASHGVAPELVTQLQRFSNALRAPVAAAYRSAQPLWLEDPDKCEGVSADLPEELRRVGSVVALPLVVRGAVLFAVAYRFDVPRAFLPEDRALLETFSVQAALALDRAQSYAREMASRRRVETLGECAKALSAALTLEDVAEVVVAQGMRAAQADICTLYSLDDASGALELVAERGCSAQVREAVRRIEPDPNHPVYRTFLAREQVWAESDAAYAAYAPSLASMKGDGPRARAFWSMPLMAEGRPIGLLGMGYYAPRHFSLEERDFVGTFVRQCAEAFLRARRVESERAARALAERLQASFSTTLRSIGDAVIATDAVGKVTLMNGIAESLTGWREAEARGLPLSEVFRIVNEHTRAVVQSPVAKVLEEGAIVGLANHTVLVARDGREIPIDDSGAPIRAEGGGAIEGVVLVFRDVAAKKRQESRAVFLEEATLALTSSLDYETTLRKVAQLAVPRLADWCGVDVVPEGETAAKRVAVAHVDPNKVALARELEAKYPAKADAASGVPHVLRTGKPELYASIGVEQVEASALDDEHRRLLRAAQLRSAMIVPLLVRGRAIGALTFVYGESGRNYVEEDLQFAEELAERCAVAIDNARLFASEQRARQSADVANRAKDEFLAVVSHELRTPLNAIMGWSKMMASRDFDEGRRARAVETIERNAVAMAQLIEDLLDISRIISGKMRLEMQDVDLARVIEAAVDSIRPAADAKGIQLTALVDAGVPPLVGDPARLQQVVWNLLSNAVKFTGKGGKVDVVLALDQSRAEIRVTDTGKGIAPRFLPHVFDAFRQEDASYARSRGGIGLGLAITRQLVELHGGRIEARSDGEGRGASFLVSLPIAAVARDTPSRAREARRITSGGFEKPTQLQGLRVLVVDDELDARHLLKEILEYCGCQVRTAGGVEEAMAALADAVPDVLISDIGMPGLDGYELIRRVRELAPDRGGEVPAAALTAYARAEDRQRMLNAGYSMHIPKPVEPAELLTVVGSLTRFSRARSTAD
ncbi:MAG TPA: GAF domain-containing protein [Polyangiaceae bacterium]